MRERLDVCALEGGAAALYRDDVVNVFGQAPTAAGA
jgi:hypothetical protein